MRERANARDRERESEPIKPACLPFASCLQAPYELLTSCLERPTPAAYELLASCLRAAYGPPKASKLLSAPRQPSLPTTYELLTKQTACLRLAELPDMLTSARVRRTHRAARVTCPPAPSCNAEASRFQAGAFVRSKKSLRGCCRLLTYELLTCHFRSSYLTCHSRATPEPFPNPQKPSYEMTPPTL